MNASDTEASFRIGLNGECGTAMESNSMDEDATNGAKGVPRRNHILQYQTASCSASVQDSGNISASSYELACDMDTSSNSKTLYCNEMQRHNSKYAFMCAYSHKSLAQNKHCSDLDLKNLDRKCFRNDAIEHIRGTVLDHAEELDDWYLPHNCSSTPKVTISLLERDLDDSKEEHPSNYRVGTSEDNIDMFSQRIPHSDHPSDTVTDHICDTVTVTHCHFAWSLGHILQYSLPRPLNILVLLSRDMEMASPTNDYYIFMSLGILILSHSCKKTWSNDTSLGLTKLKELLKNSSYSVLRRIMGVFNIQLTCKCDKDLDLVLTQWVWHVRQSEREVWIFGSIICSDDQPHKNSCNKDFHRNIAIPVKGTDTFLDNVLKSYLHSKSLQTMFDPGRQQNVSLHKNLQRTSENSSTDLIYHPSLNVDSSLNLCDLNSHYCVHHSSSSLCDWDDKLSLSILGQTDICSCCSYFPNDSEIYQNKNFKRQNPSCKFSKHVSNQRSKVHKTVTVLKKKHTQKRMLKRYRSEHFLRFFNLQSEFHKRNAFSKEVLDLNSELRPLSCNKKHLPHSSKLVSEINNDALLSQISNLNSELSHTIYRSEHLVCSTNVRSNKKEAFSRQTSHLYSKSQNNVIYVFTNVGTTAPKSKSKCTKSDFIPGRKSKRHKSDNHFHTSCLIFILWNILTSGLPLASSQGLSGTLSRCSTEGEIISIPGITDDPCIDCVCKNGIVSCEEKSCPNVEGCHAILFDRPSKMCCKVCKGCRYRGSQYQSGDSWLDPRDPCITYICRAGVVTRSRVQCFNPCYNTTKVEGQCCPVCSGCYFRGHTYQEGDSFRLPSDVCTNCLCKNGSLVCTREQCPVLNCPPDVIYQPKKECCPKCRNMRTVFDVPRTRCYFAKQLYKKHQRFRPDRCSKCVCKSRTSVCQTKICPALDCPVSERLPNDSSGCCERCIERANCVSQGNIYKHKEEWRPDVCTNCMCEDGTTYCQRERCSNSLWCPQGYKLVLTKNECCPKCVEYNAVCSVFGDPHYRTFDGLMYSFQGTCKYILAKDCQKDEFLIKVRNGVRFSSGYAWTQMLVIFVLGHRVSMLQNSVVKVDRHRKKLPFIIPGKMAIRRSGDMVTMKTTVGLEVTWDGDSFLEVVVSARFKHRMCGLCGNYNGIKSDDLTRHDGTMFMKGEEYGHTWRIGGKKACKIKPQLQQTLPSCELDKRSRQRAHKSCSVLYGHSFSDCHRLVPVDVYVRSCITDMCDCPRRRKCACEAIKAYVSQCEREGGVVDWETISHCGPKAELRCPANSVQVSCDQVCPRTCENPSPKGACPNICEQSCECEGDLLYSEAGHCVQPDKCDAIQEIVHS